MKNILLYLFGILLLASCIDEKGNYDYTDVNKLAVRLDESYKLRINDTVVKITPELSQSLNQNKENLKFVWLHSTVSPVFYHVITGQMIPGASDTLSLSETLDFRITADTKKYTHYLRLNVYDNLTGIEYAAKTTIQLIKPYWGTWMVLHREDNTTKLGTVEYIGNNYIVQDDAYFKETGKHLQGNPLCLFGIDRVSYYFYRSSANLFGIFTDIANESGVYYQWEKFKKADSMSRSVAPTYRPEFDFSNYEFSWGNGVDYGFGCISGGDYYHTVSASKYYKAHTDPALGNLNISHCAKTGFLSVLYDKDGRRFLYYYSPNRNAVYNGTVFDETVDNPENDMIRTIPVRSTNVKTADPSNIDPEQKVVYVGTGYKYAPANNRTYAYAVAVKGADSCFVYEFPSYGMVNSSDASFTGYYRMKAIPGLTEDSHFASSEDYSGILFYTSGNKVYRLDFKQTGGKATLIYTHPAGNVVKMRFARSVSYEQDYSGYEFPLKKSLGIAVEMPDGTGELVILNLDDSGKVGKNSDTYDAKQVHKGFGFIKDVVFI